MSVQTPPRLLDLAGTSLLRDEASAISAVEDLPTELFPPLFMEAFHGRHIETLKAMVQAWPFVRLPLGDLIDMPHVGPLQAVLEALDVLLAQKVRPRRCKLRVLDLRDTGQIFWSMWSGASTHGCSSSGMVPVAEHRSMTQEPLASLEVFIELCLKKRTLDNFLTYLIRWVEQRKVSIHLCCKKLKIVSMPMENIMTVLSMVQLDCIQEVQVNCTWHLSTLAMFAPLLGQMGNVQRLLLSPILVSAFEEQEQQHVVQITSQFLRLHHLRDLYMHSPSFLEGCLDQMLRCLKTPLDNLSITNCWLTDSDLIHLSQCPNIRQLKGLDLSGVMLTDFSPVLLQVLLEQVAASLQELNLEQCGISDFQLESILPVLSHCSQLRTFSLCGNLLSMTIMEKLLCRTTGMPHLSDEFYPAPQESYSPHGALHLGRLAQLWDELIEIMRNLGCPRAIWLSSSPCPRWGNKTFYQEEPFLYHCYISA
ncbi:PRAME family member 15-like isoform X1 [Balaenoptera acutorostrata]|uniref:PRAME family member 15-like isoform X1 n=1 Tax=Balaenoptera acutorostrata TaxID=9767 RepID=A0ABM3UBY8_BALAC|nr:PRAME family member 15-like isoform X1 [Balaenoptera acutorostrata]